MTNLWLSMFADVGVGLLVIFKNTLNVVGIHANLRHSVVFFVVV